MNREIKFRQPVFNNSGSFSHYHHWGWISEGCFISPLSMGHNVDGVKGDQYTGMKDIDNKELYQGDIVECPKNGIQVIEWSDDVAGWIFNDKKSTEDWTDTIDVWNTKLIGNIYENKELLEDQMITIEAVKVEYFRIERLLKQEALNRSIYNSYCKKGFSAYLIKRDLGLTYNGMKEIIGAKFASTLYRGDKKQLKADIYCSRDEGGMIKPDKCIVGCNPIACDPCPNKQLDNIQAGSDTLTQEQETLMRHEGTRGSGYSDMIVPFAEI